MVLRALAIGMPGVSDDFFVPFHTIADNQLRLLHCELHLSNPPMLNNLDPSAPREDFEQGEKGRINAHTDFSTCTMLFQDDCGGLEVEDPVCLRRAQWFHEYTDAYYSIDPGNTLRHLPSRAPSSST